MPTPSRCRSGWTSSRLVRDDTARNLRYAPPQQGKKCMSKNGLASQQYDAACRYGEGGVISNTVYGERMSA